MERQISPDGKTARTEIGRSYGGLGATGHEVPLKKIGYEWFVLSMKLIFLS